MEGLGTYGIANRGPYKSHRFHLAPQTFTKLVSYKTRPGEECRRFFVRVGPYSSPPTPTANPPPGCSGAPASTGDGGSRRQRSAAGSPARATPSRKPSRAAAPRAASSWPWPWWPLPPGASADPCFGSGGPPHPRAPHPLPPWSPSRRRPSALLTRAPCSCPFFPSSSSSSSAASSSSSCAEGREEDCGKWRSGLAHQLNAYDYAPEWVSIISVVMVAEEINKEYNIYLFIYLYVHLFWEEIAVP